MRQAGQQESWHYCSAVGEDSHRFVSQDDAAGQPERRLVLAGIVLPGEPALAGNSDADVVLHALINAISGLTARNILGKRADTLCLEQGITDSSVYLAEAMRDLEETGWELLHLSFSIEAARPRLSAWIEPMRRQVSCLTGLPGEHIGLTATSGEGLTAFGRGEGIRAVCLASGRCR